MIIYYLKSKYKTILLDLILLTIFLICALLYNISTEFIIYTISLFIFTILIFFIIDYIQFYNKHKLLTKIYNSKMMINDELISSNDLIEKDYKNIIGEMSKREIEKQSEFDNTKEEILEYFTLWVHQIKTPISALKLLLNTDNIDNQELELELFKIDEYVNMALQYLRLDSNSVNDFIIQDYSLDEIVKQAIHKYAKVFIKKKIRIELKELNYKVVTDEKWLLFVIEQIISNSLKYTRSGKISIYIENNMLIIEDTGIGISSQDIPRIFERGYTGYNGRNDKKATGIGLYLSKKILNKLGHEIKIESEIDEGTKVKLIFAEEK